MSTATLPQPVVYPALRINGTEYQFRYTRTSAFLLESWGYDLSPGKTIPALAWAAAMAGFVDSTGKYRSASFKTPSEFTDMFALEDDLTPVFEAVSEAIKKALPKATLTLVPSPAPNSSSAAEQPAS